MGVAPLSGHMSVALRFLMNGPEFRHPDLWGVVTGAGQHGLLQTTRNIKVPVCPLSRNSTQSSASFVCVSTT